MMFKISELSDFDIFFYYGSNALDLEIESDLMCGILQSKRSMIYNRSYGGDIKENYPNALTQAILVPYNITAHIGRENQKISDGTKFPDRRVATSQSAIKIEQEGSSMNVFVPYVPFSDYTKLKGVKAPMGA